MTEAKPIPPVILQVRSPLVSKSQRADSNQDDLSSFHAQHFSAVANGHFSEQFLGPVVESYQEEEAEDDRLGYYPDGVKRTLTDEQIAIFRHSEVQAILRERRHAEEARYSGSEAHMSDQISEVGELEDGELEEDIPESTAELLETITPPPPMNGQKPSKKQRKAQNAARQKAAKQKSSFKQYIKPDLRKRTWDKVDAGMDSLAYDEEPNAGATLPSQNSQRRRISYDD